MMGRRSNSHLDASDRALQHERAAQEERHWVRLTRACNNHCAFCLDELASTGAMVPEQEVREEIARGRQRGATRLILSGGEPTIHPLFLRFVKAGRQAGYGHVQLVTNGRMLAYPRLLERCINAGLDEVTLSIHGPDAAMHDSLVGVPGAFAQTLEALRLALASGRLVVSVDVCINRVNVWRLGDIVERFWALGVTEFDLLQVIPFGRAFQDGQALLTYDLDRARPQLQRVLKIAQRPGIHVWFNRFPPPHLEGHEQLIQDPHKLHDEVRGRREELSALVIRGQPLRCRQPQRCVHCYLHLLCDTLEEARAALQRQDSFEVYRAQVGQGPPPPAPPWPLPHVWVRAPDVVSAAAALDLLPGRELTLELDSFSGLASALDHGSMGGKLLRRVYVSAVKDLEALLAHPGDFEVVAYLSLEMATHLQAHLPAPPARLALARRDHARASDARALDADLPLFFAEYPPVTAVEGVPRCISGQDPRPRPRVLDASMLQQGAEGPALDLVGFTERFIVEHNYSKSLRCGGCPWDHRCRGAQLNYLRAHGYATLQPPTTGDGG